MLKKTISYTDYDGNERTEDFYFNLTKAECAEMEVSTGGMSEMIRKIVAAQNIPEIAAVFKNVILRAYGEKSLDGRRFMKSEEITKAFTETEAYSDLYMELATNPDKAAEFVNGIIPNASNDAKSKPVLSQAVK